MSSYSNLSFWATAWGTSWSHIESPQKMGFENKMFRKATIAWYTIDVTIVRSWTTLGRVDDFTGLLDTSWRHMGSRPNNLGIKPQLWSPYQKGDIPHKPVLSKTTLGYVDSLIKVLLWVYMLTPWICKLGVNHFVAYHTLPRTTNTEDTVVGNQV